MQDIEKIYEEYFEIVNKYLFCLTHNNDIDMVVDYDYKFNIVTDSDIVRPDTTDCIVNE